MQDPEEERLMVDGLSAGQAPAARTFLTRAHHAVFCLSGRLARDGDRQQDWTHAVLLGIVEDCARGAFEYRGPGSFWAWFRRRAWFRLLDEYRRWRVRSAREVADDDALASAVSHAGGQDPADELQRVEYRAALEACLEGLERLEHRQALEQVLLFERPYEEVARNLNARLNTVRAWIRRGRIAMRLCLAVRLGWPLPGHVDA